MTCGLAVLFALVGLAIAAGSARAIGPREMDVSQLSDNGDSLVATFTTAKCQRSKKKNALLNFTAKAISTNKAWTLRVYLKDFNGFTDYPLAYGGDADPWFTVIGPSGFYSNLESPPEPPGGGGGLAFSPAGKRMSLGFVPTFDKTLNQGVSVAGAVKCVYPKKKRKHKH
jgi:hypothetical protein